jgi:hypothetical protein
MAIARPRFVAWRRGARERWERQGIGARER